MCRLFGLTAGARRVRATFWLLEAPDSLRRQSRANPDGTGLGTFDAGGRPCVEKQPLAAYRDVAFATEAKERHSTTFVAHVRHSSGTPAVPENTHPFTLDGRIFAHHGVVEGLPELDDHLGDDRRLVGGQTDSERIFALVTRETARAGGDAGTGIARALSWVADHLPVYAANVVLTTATDLWAVRYPDTHALWVLERHEPRGHLLHRSAAGTCIVCHELARAPSVVVASERLDDDDRWRMLEPGVLLHIDRHLAVRERVVVGETPRHRLRFEDLGIEAARSQHPTGF